MISNTLVSIIVPIYNSEKHLRQCIDSLVHQSCNNIEIILVDDGSSDLSAEICDEYVKNDKRVKVLHQVNGGPSAARKNGLKKANGKYIMFMDADDWLDVNTIDICIKSIAAYPSIDCLMFSYKKEYEGRSVIKHTFSEDLFFNRVKDVKEKVYRRVFGLTNDELNHPESLEYLSSCCMKLYNRAIIREPLFVSTVEVGSGEDGLFNMSVFKYCQEILYIDCPLYHYRKTKGSLTSKYRPNVIEEWDRLFGYMQNWIYSEDLDMSFQEALNNRIALSILGVGLNGLDYPNSNLTYYYRYIKNYLSSEKYKRAISTMELKRLPLAWKILMFCAKHRLTICVVVALKTIRLLKPRQ